MKPPLTDDERHDIAVALRAQANQIASFYEAGRSRETNRHQYPDPVLTALDMEMSRLRQLAERVKPESLFDPPE